jgi:mRNA interferase HigB
MDILTPSRFADAGILYPNDKAGLDRCLRLLKVARPRQFSDLQRLFGAHGVDLFKPRAAMNWVVIDVGGNALRVIGGVSYTRQKFYVKHVYTHAEYDVANVWYARNKGVKR